MRLLGADDREVATSFGNYEAGSVSRGVSNNYLMEDTTVFRFSILFILALLGLIACDSGSGILPTEPLAPGIARLQVYLQQDCTNCGLVDVQVDVVHAGTIQPGEWIFHEVVPGPRNVVATGRSCSWAGTTNVGQFGQLYTLCCGGCDDGDSPG